MSSAATSPSSAPPDAWAALDAALDLLDPPPPANLAARYPTPGHLARAVDPTMVQTPALELIDRALVDVAEGRTERLIISMSPQEGKSQRTSRSFPTWILLRDPDLRIAIASYEQHIAGRWGRAIRNDILTNSGAQQSLDLGLRLAPDSQAQASWELDSHRGGVYSVGIGGALTGRPVDVLIIDDPLKDRAQADSEAYRNRAWSWWTDVARTRLAPGAPVVLILTRWHQDDLAGRLLADDAARAAAGEPVEGWQVINIPAEAESADPASDPLGRQPGEFMLSARGRTDAQWRQIKAGAGARTWASLYQGRPSPEAGDVLQRGWWRRYTVRLHTEADGVCTVPDVDEVVQSWDMAFKDTRGSDWVVGQVWARRGPDAFLLEQIRARMGFTTSKAAVERMTARWPQASAKLIEDKANGPAVIDALTKTVSGLIAVEPSGSKYARASAVSPFLEAGNVYIPADTLAPWAGDLVEEAAAFPNGAHDDQVDALSQALHRLLLRPGQGQGFLAAWKAMAAKTAA